MKAPNLYLLLLSLLVSACSMAPEKPREDTTISPANAIQLAASAAPDVVDGYFSLTVQATGRQGKMLYLNSELDYRDQRNLTVAIAPGAAAELRSIHAEDPEVYLKGKEIVVKGAARRVKIWFISNSKRTNKYYYQTHVLVGAAGQIEIVQGATPRSPQSKTVHIEAVSNREAIEELLVLMNTDSMMDGIYSQMGQMMQGTAEQLGIDESNREILERFMVEMGAIMKQEMSWEKMREPMIEVYLKHYTRKEISDMIAFYESESGRSMIAKMPAVMQDSMLISQTLLKDFLPRIQVLMTQMSAEILAASQIAD